ncbi:hypothetical protein JW859_14780 [bacterium]|nr:hypothetical protein [bacterium]
MLAYEFVLALTFIICLFTTINALIKRGRGPVIQYKAQRKKEPEMDSAASALLDIERMRQHERAEARKLYERLVLEKLEIINNAVSMGYSDQELKQLDARLERLVGPEKLTQLLDETPTVQLREADLLDEDLQAQITRLQQQRQPG